MISTARQASVFVTLALFTMGCGKAPDSSQEALPPSPLAAVDELLAADRGFAAASAGTDLVTGISAMFADDITLPLPGGQWATGKPDAVRALQANPDNPASRAEWTPVRGGVSADGQQGFTVGYLTVHKADSTVVPAKYLAYWVKGPAGWRVVAYKRGRRPEGAVSLATMPAAIPDALVPPTTDSTIITGHRASLVQAEQAFSDEAQSLGIGPAFAKHGSPDAMNMGGPNDTGFVVGAEAIGRGIGGTPPGKGSPVSWKSDKVIVASSGDLGVSLGMIRSNERPDAPGVPFFTIWRRASPGGPWRYIAE